MKLKPNKWPSVDEIKKINLEREKRYEEAFLKIVEKFMNETVLPLVLTSEAGYVSVKVPSEAYRDLEKFENRCKSIIPAGYDVGISHDGGGEYNTLVVSWE